MATSKIALDTRQNCKTVDGKYPVILQVGHQSKTRTIAFKNLYAGEGQFEPTTGKVSGVLNAVSHNKRIQHIHSSVDLWIANNASEIKHWPISKLIAAIRRQFFNEEPDGAFLAYAGRYLWRLNSEGRFSTATSYEEALKTLVKYRRYQAREKNYNDPIEGSLFNFEDETVKKDIEKVQLKELYRGYDLSVKAIDFDFAKNFEAWMAQHKLSINSVRIKMRSIQAMLNDAVKSVNNEGSIQDIKKGSVANKPNPLKAEEIGKIMSLDLVEGSPIWHRRNYLYTMFTNMGMNFTDLAAIRVNQVEVKNKRLSYTRNKTRRQSSPDHFSNLQTDEGMNIINHYMIGKEPDDYLFPILSKDIAPDKVRLTVKSKLKQFNEYMREMLSKAGIERNVSSYSVRDGWVDEAYAAGVDTRTVAHGLGHGSLDTVDKHYAKAVAKNKLDKMNTKITKRIKPS